MKIKWEIEAWVEQFAQSSYDYFYPTAVQKSLNYGIDEIFAYLKNLVSEGKLIMELEIECPYCFQSIPLSDNVVGAEILCDGCDRYFELDKGCIFPKFRVEPAYKEHVKKNIQALQVSIYPKSHMAGKEYLLQI